MQWPPWSSSSQPSQTSAPKSAVPWSSTLNATDWSHYTQAQVIVPTCLLSATVIGSWAFYRSYLRRIPGAAYIKPGWFRRRTVFGKVVRVGDGDNFHLFHTPGGRLAGWGWARTVPEWSTKSKNRRTIPIRIAGIDAPENAHFGKEAQPHAAEALQWLQSYLLQRRVRARIYSRDQYNRIVATVYVRRYGLRRDVGLEMLKAGLATVYEAKTGAEFGELEHEYRDAEKRAKAARKGIWAQEAAVFESPRDYKTRTAAAAAAADEHVAASKDTDAGSAGKGWLSGLLPRLFSKK